MCEVNHFCLFLSLSIPFEMRWSGATLLSFGQRRWWWQTQNSIHITLTISIKCHETYTLCYAITTGWIVYIKNGNHINHLTSYHFSIATNLKCNRHTGIHMEKYDELMWLWTLRMCWTVVLMLKPWSKMKYRLNDGPWTRISLDRNWCCLGFPTKFTKHKKKKENEIKYTLPNSWVLNAFTCWFIRNTK